MAAPGLAETASAVTAEDIVAFVYAEARLLDECRYEDWLDLFAEDGRYWIPAEWDQTDPVMQPSLLYEDRFMLDVRIRRLRGARTYSQKPNSRCVHVLQQPSVEAMDEAANSYRTWTPFHYVETRGDERDYFNGWARHDLMLEGGALKIRLKRVDLVNLDAPFGNIQLFM